MLSHVWLYGTPWTVAHQVVLSMEFFRQEYCSGWPFSSPILPQIILKILPRNTNNTFIQHKRFLKVMYQTCLSSIISIKFVIIVVWSTSMIFKVFCFDSRILKKSSSCLCFTIRIVRATLVWVKVGTQSSEWCSFKSCHKVALRNFSTFPSFCRTVWKPLD